MVDGDLELILIDTQPGDLCRGIVPAYHFAMVLTRQVTPIGGIHLRVGHTPYLELYSGHIGYNVSPAHRGHRYAVRSIKLLHPLMRRHGFKTIWITCDPDNNASRRTCELAGGRLVEIVDLAKDTDLYRRGRRQVCRYRFDL